ncbi:matrix protein [Wenling frogfish filovirus]|uniref:Matrix protein n=1 Tax=Wenling frogfish filovirus TaxID=2116487 RepID=A0A2P1GMN8_9MONO|nr:matrix protein [Wenling frogfish filovirus]AVM87234.1 matrix protein [Wenling frogfish filovirus]
MPGTAAQKPIIWSGAAPTDPQTVLGTALYMSGQSEMPLIYYNFPLGVIDGTPAEIQATIASLLMTEWNVNVFMGKNSSRVRLNKVGPVDPPPPPPKTPFVLYHGTQLYFADQVLNLASMPASGSYPVTATQVKAVNLGPDVRAAACQCSPMEQGETRLLVQPHPNVQGLSLTTMDGGFARSPSRSAGTKMEKMIFEAKKGKFTCPPSAPGVVMFPVPSLKNSKCPDSYVSSRTRGKQIAFYLGSAAVSTINGSQTEPIMSQSCSKICPHHPAPEN